MPEDTKKTFPKDFLWGASTSAHQVEGGNHNQWTVWELSHASELAQSAHKRLSSWLPVWNQIKNQAQNPDTYVSGRGIEHYKLYKQDFELLKKLNLNAFRFSIEWSRIEPEEGKWNEEAIEHYRQYIKELKKRDIEPILNIWHWSHPVWFEEKGGFLRRRNINYFDRFVHKVAEELTADVKYIITLNEPNIYVTYSYLSGEFPPQQKSLINTLRVYLHLSHTHRRAYYLLKHQKPSLQIGIAAQLANIQAKRPHNLFDELATKWMRYSWNWWFLRRIRHEQDFVGMNYYFTDYYKGFVHKNPDQEPSDDQELREQQLPGVQRANPKAPVNDLRWYMEPEGLYPLLIRAWVRFKKPIIVTENGLADMHDQYRRWWLEETIVAMERALSEGVDLRGYFYWSLLDNFEWANGWWPKFGLVAVDRRRGMKRVIRPSAKWFAAKIKKLT